MDADLEKRINDRKKQAKDMQISSKAETVIAYLGDSVEPYSPKGRGIEGSFSEDDVNIKFARNYDWDGPDDVTMRRCTFLIVQIKYARKLVFEETWEFNDGWELNTYLPGEWGQKLDALYANALLKKEKIDLKKEQEKRKEEQKKESDLRSKFGL